MSDYQFINPYNFIPLASQCVRTKTKDEKVYTGYIECTLKTLTPMIMIDTEDYKDDQSVPGHKIYPTTYSLNGHPAIPASELRGMIRNKFETLTNSCLSSAEPELSFYGRYNGNMTHPGILEFNDSQNVKLYKCKKYRVINPNSVKNKNTGCKLRFDIEIVRRENKKSSRKKYIEEKMAIVHKDGHYIGFLKVGENLGKKGNQCHMFVKTCEEVKGSNHKELKNKKDLKKFYQEVCEIVQENKKGKKHVSETKSKLKFVWYEVIDDYVYFSLGQNGQTKYRRKYKDLGNQSYLPCSNPDDLCEACQVFGTIQNNLVLASKIRFEDALLVNDNKDIYVGKDVIVIEELSSPKYNNPAFYLLQIKNGEIVKKETPLWNVDFSKKIDERAQLLKDDEVKIRGRKEYWHHKPLLKKVNKTIRNISAKPVKEGIEYRFKVYFNDLTELQLEHLNMAISLGNNSDYSHKLGAGKPLGFGSVKIKTEKIIYKDMRFTDGKIEYVLNEYQPKCTTIENAFKTLNSFQLLSIQNMYSFSFLQKNYPQVRVDYPRNTADGKIYEWFQENKHNKIKTILPFSEEEYDHALIQKGYKKSVNNNASKNNYKRQK